MHEMSLVRSLLNQVERLCREHQGISVDEIEVEIGPLSGVEPLLLQDAFQTIAPQTNCKGSELVIKQIPLKALCQDCGQESELPALEFSCQVCGGRSVRITQGDEFRLLNVTLQTDG